MEKKYTVYGIDNCPYCKNAVSVLEARKLNYDYKHVPNDISKEEVGKELGLKMSTAPFIIYNDGEKDVFVGGFQQLMPFINKNR